MTIDLTGAVLLPVDLQRAFDEPSWPRRWNDALDANGLAILSAWRAARRPLIHVRHDSVEPASSLRPERPGHRFRAGFEPLPGEELVAKSVNSAFIGTDLDLRLRRLDARRVVVFGLSTDMCVSTTIRTGANLGWSMLLVADACDCFDLPDGTGGTLRAEAIQAAHVATLGFEFCQAVTTQDLIAAVM